MRRIKTFILLLVIITFSSHAQSLKKGNSYNSKVELPLISSVLDGNIFEYKTSKEFDSDYNLIGLDLAGYDADKGVISIVLQFNKEIEAAGEGSIVRYIDLDFDDESDVELHTSIGNAIWTGTKVGMRYRNSSGTFVTATSGTNIVKGIKINTSYKTVSDPPTETTLEITLETDSLIIRDDISEEYGNHIPSILLHKTTSDTLIAFYPFNGNANDESGNNNHGIYYGSTHADPKPALDRFFNENSAFYFDGVDDYITIHHSDEIDFNSYSDSYSISLWMKAGPKNSSGGTIIAKGGLTTPFNIKAYAPFLVANILINGVGPQVQYGDVYDREWKHIVFLVNHTEGKIEGYINGVLKQSITLDLTSPSSNVSQVLIGGGMGTFFEGYIDDVKIFNYDLSETEIQELFSEGGVIDQQAIRITSPNGGEIWEEGKKNNITWVSNNVDSVKIEYSTDNGENWSTIISSIESNINYMWEIPNIRSAQCKVKISNIDDPTVFDESDALFTISEPTDELLAFYPFNGNANDESGNNNNGTLNGAPQLALDRFFNENSAYYFDGIDDYITIPHTDELNFDPLVNSYSVSLWIKGGIQDSSYGGTVLKKGLGNYISSPLDIQAIVTNLAANTSINNAGWQISFGDVYNYEWKHVVLNVDSSNSTMAGYLNGTLKDAIGFGKSLSAGNNEPIYIGGTINFFKGYIDDIRFFNYVLSQEEINDLYTEGGFTPTQKAIKLITPNGGENWEAGTTRSITWASNGIDVVKIQYSTNNGTTWYIATSSTDTKGTYNWEVPNELSTSCKIKISNVDDPIVFDESDIIFTISKPTDKLVVYYPFNGNANDESGNSNPGTVYGASLAEDRFGNPNSAYSFDGIDDYITSSSSISWENLGLNDNMSISVWVSIDSLWIVDSEIKRSFILNNFDTLDANVYCWSAGVLEHEGVTPPFTEFNTWDIIGGSGYGNTQTGIIFSKWHHLAYVIENKNQLYIYEDGKKTSTYRIQALTAETGALYIGKNGNNASFYKYLWNGLIDDIRIYDYALNDSEIADLYYEGGWAGGKRISITSPNGGENWHVGSNYNITWTSENIENVKLEFSTNGGSSWVTIDTLTASDGIYEWTVPFNALSPFCKIRISDYTNPDIFEESEEVFTVYDQVPELFTEQTSIRLPGIYYGSVDWGDYNNDGYLDLLITGDQIFRIFKNNSGNSFSALLTSSFSFPLSFSSAKWGDYNNDGYLDFIVAGFSEGRNSVSKIFKNNGDGTFTEQTSIQLTPVHYGSVDWGDYNNDGYLDILLTGEVGDNTGTGISKIYKNNKDGSFEEATSISLENVLYSSADWGDYNSDGYLDILLTGNRKSIIYKNNGDGSFTAINSISLPGISSGSVEWGDYNADGYLDILMAGYSDSEIIKIYHNNQNETFTALPLTNLIGIAYCSVTWADYDNDGDLDILAAGQIGDSQVRKTSIYQNNGDGTFAEDETANLIGVGYSSAAWGDYDNDGDLDILLTGFIDNDNTVSKIYKNNNTVSNTPPAVPVNLSSSINRSNVILGWDKSTDNETIQDALNYNLVIGTSSGEVNILSPMADLSNGYRRVVRKGIVQSNRWTIQNLPDGTYYWSVQAIDASFAGSKFSDGNSFIIGSQGVSDIKLATGDIIRAGTTEDIKWTSENVEKIKIDYSIDNGKNWMNIADSVISSGRVYNWLVPEVESDSCIIKITDIDNSNVTSETSSLFTIFKYSSSLNLSTSLTFGNTSTTASFRMISLPGIIDKNISSNLIGSEGSDWTVYYDDGTSETFIKYDGSTLFNYNSGSGFWLLSKNPWEVNESTAAVSLGSDNTYSIPLHTGWNIIGNPFDKTIHWESVKSANNITGNLYSYTGSYSSADTFVSYEGYYYYNVDNKTELKIPYIEKNSSLSKLAASTGSSILINLFNGNESISSVEISYSTASEVGYDKLDQFAPPGDFENERLVIYNDSLKTAYKYLYVDSRESISGLQSYNLLLKNLLGRDLELYFDGIEKLADGEEAYILDTEFGLLTNLRKVRSLKVGEKSLKKKYKLFIGSKEFVNNAIANFLPEDYSLYPNYPNPFNSSTKIRFSLPEQGNVKVEVYNVLGERVALLINNVITAGYHEVSFDAGKLTSGIYFYRLSTNKFTDIKKMVFLK